MADPDHTYNRSAIESAQTLSVLEDLYLPYRPKRRTRAAIAREKGLEPLADILFNYQAGAVPDKESLAFVDVEKGVGTSEEALAGARDILAERVSEDGVARTRMRDFYRRKALVRSKAIYGKEEEENRRNLPSPS